MRKPHFWRKAKATAAPSNILVFDCETWHDYMARVLGGELQTFRLAVALAFRYERGKRTRERKVFARHPREVSALIRERLDPRRPLWIWGHNLPYDMGAARLWSMLFDPSFLADRVILTPGTTFVRGTMDGCPVVLIDTLNYLKVSLETIGKNLGLAKLPMPPQDAPDSDHFVYCARDVEVTALAITSLIDFVRDQELGPWQPTAAGLAFSAFRHRFMRHNVLVHCNPLALHLERGAYYGGAVDTAFIGRTQWGPVSELDVVSMYPAVCCRELPVKLHKVVDRPGASDVLRFGDRGHVIADVTISSRAFTFPLRTGGKVYHPHGTYRTTLAWPELQLAFRNGCVVDIHRAAFYGVGKCFESYARYFTDLKAEFRAAGDGMRETFAKLLANSLYGKTGQRSPRWREWGQEAMTAIEAEAGLPADTLAFLIDSPPSLEGPEETFGLPEFGLTLHVRDYYGVCEVMVKHGESRDSCPAIAATVTSYARCMLREYQRTAGEGHWYYSDTDSIWCDDTGRKRLEDAGHVRPGELGYLDIKRQHDWLHVYGPKDYATPEGTKLKGVKARARKLREGKFVQLQFPSAMAQLKKPNPLGVMVRRVVKVLRRTIDRCHVHPNGWTRPLISPQEIPQ